MRDGVVLPLRLALPSALGDAQPGLDGHYCEPGICISSDTSIEPPISRKGHDLAIARAASMDSAETMVKPDIAVLPPALTL